MQANRYRNTTLFPKPFHARDFLMNFEQEATVPPTLAPKKKQAKSPGELLSLARSVANMYNKDNARVARREQERIERRRNAKPLGATNTRGRHGR
jgi:hypothetical protein